MCTCCPQRSEDDVGSSVAGVADSCALPCGCLELKSGPLQEHPMLLTGGSHLSSPVMANLGCQFDIPGKRDPQRKNCLHWIGLWPCLGSHFLHCNLWKRAQCTVGDGTSRQVDL